MKVLIVYDSLYGNTEKIAQAIGGAISGEVKVLPVGQASPADLTGIELFIVGSPTQGSKSTKAIQDFLNAIPKASIKGLNIAAFDTRMANRLMRVFGFAAPKIADSLKSKGGSLILSPEGFFVKGMKGPLKEGELERAVDWAKGVIAASTGKKELA